VGVAASGGEEQQGERQASHAVLSAVFIGRTVADAQISVSAGPQDPASESASPS
jgi:hypothetical protein